MCRAPWPSPAPLSPWQPAHHFVYTVLPAVVSWAVKRLEEPRNQPPNRQTAKPPSFAAHFPRPRLPSCLIVEEEHDRPDLVLGQELFPRRHRRIPRRPFARQSRSALGDAPKNEALRQLRDRAVVLEVGRQRIQAGREVAQAIEMVTVTAHAVLIVDPMSFVDVRREVALLAERVLESREGHRLATERDLRRWGRVDRTQIGRRRDAGFDLTVGEAPNDERDGGQQSVPHHFETRLNQDFVQRLFELS